jgi:hypothetical protein
MGADSIYGIVRVKMKFVTIQTIYTGEDGNRYNRNVTLCKCDDGKILLLGKLDHRTEIIVNQDLIDELKEMENE